MTYLDLRTPGWRDALLRRLAADGMAPTTGITSREEMQAVARELVEVRWHPLNDPDGITTLADQGDQRPGWGAHANVELPPHTDGSAVEHPPRLILVSCLQSAAEGGESWFIDGKAVYETLAENHPAELEALSEPGSVVFNGYRSAIFEGIAGRVVVRIRFDDLVEYGPEVHAALPALKAAIAEHTQTVRLNSGEGYVVDNSRWIHGRAAFAGDRVMLRALGDLLPGSVLPLGFPVDGSGHR